MKTQKDDTVENEQTTVCKHCGTTLKNSDIRKLSKKELPPRYGVLWTGIEFPYLQIYKITCHNLACGKKYSVKKRLSRWLYK